MNARSADFSLSGTPLLSLRDVTITYEGDGLALPWTKKPKPAVKNVSFDIPAGRTFGLVGESGSGKSTTGRAILRLLDVDSGSILFDGVEVTKFGRNTPLSYRRDVQVVFQDPSLSLNPLKPVSTAVTALLSRHGLGDSAERERRAIELFDQVGLPKTFLDRYPNEMSGGQQQRVAIARAFALRPRLVVCDEALSALDLSTQDQILTLLHQLQKETGVAYLFIGHNLEIVRGVSDEIAVMWHGEIVERGTPEKVFEHASHGYTRKLLAAIPAVHPAGREERRNRRLAFASGRKRQESLV